MGIDDITRDGVLRTLTEHDELGGEAFCARYGVKPTRGYRLLHERREYDSRAIVGVAHRYVDGHLLASERVRGGAATIARVLEGLSFRVETANVVGEQQPSDADARVLVCPSFGSPEARRHWEDTLNQTVPFGRPLYAERLADNQLADLMALHPEGEARFWGATPVHDNAMEPVRTGDIALFTGRKKVLAVGEVGAIFRNADLADTLWPPSHAGGKSWHTVYSLREFVAADISYELLAGLIGYSAGYGFPGQLVLDGDKARRVIDGLGITPRTMLERLGVEKLPRPVPAPRTPHPTREAELEKQHTRTVSFERSGAQVLYDREEQPLVTEFCGTVADTKAGRFGSPAGICDIYLQGPGGVEVIEAKSRTGHSYVREALSQLLDYAPYSPRPVDRLSVLVPGVLEEQDRALLHRYGLDCIERIAPGVFRRSPAPDQARRTMRDLWTAERGGTPERA